MKKIIVKITFALAVVVATGYTVYSSQTSSKMSGIALNNVEALASGEGAGITCSRSCSDGIGQCYKLYDEWGHCHFSGNQSDNCTC